MKEAFTPKIEIDKAAIYKRIKVQTDSPMFSEIDKIFDKCSLDVFRLIEVQALFTVNVNSYNIKINELEKAEKIIFCYVSIGKKICDEINEMFKKSQYLEGYLMNEIANEAVMEATNQLYAYIKSKLKKDNYNLTKRYSPGECHIEMEYQELIMTELKKDFEFDALLTESYMIDPEKSTLFAYGADLSFPELEVDYDCSTCNSMNCMYKRT
jgi:hypothetical protein